MANAFLTEKLNQVNYLTDVKYNLDWGTVKNSINNDTAALPLDPYFDRGFYNDGLIYMIRSKNDSLNPYIGGRYFIQKDGKMYERLYVTPDFILIKDTSDYGDSIEGEDAIRWLSTDIGSKRPVENETLTINYSWNSMIEDLQNKVEDKRILTADVLLKQAREVSIEIKVDVVPYSEVSSTDVKTSVINKITSYINNVKQLGGTVNRSDIVSVVRTTPGVKSVDIENIYISRANGIPEKELTAEGYEYFELSSVIVNMLNSGQIV
ncbi:Baseplate J-like protein [compost metagenome]